MNEKDTKKQNKIVKLNVGGGSVATTYGTLKASSYFKELLDGDLQDVCYVNKDEIFIDRSGYHFNYIMRYLRSCDLTLIKIKIWVDSKPKPNIIN